MSVRSLKLGILYKGYSVTSPPTNQQLNKRGLFQVVTTERTRIKLPLHSHLCLILNTGRTLTRRAQHNAIIHPHVHINDMTSQKDNHTRKCVREYLTIASAMRKAHTPTHTHRHTHSHTHILRHTLLKRDSVIGSTSNAVFSSA
jgi:hypothetical protein